MLLSVIFACAVTYHCANRCAPSCSADRGKCCNVSSLLDGSMLALKLLHHQRLGLTAGNAQAIARQRRHSSVCITGT